MWKLLEQRSQRKTRYPGSFSHIRGCIFCLFVKHFSSHSLHMGSLLLRLTLVFLPVHAGAGGSEVNVHYEDLRTPGSTNAWPWLHAPHHKGTKGQPQRYLWDP